MGNRLYWGLLHRGAGYQSIPLRCNLNEETTSRIEIIHMHLVQVRLVSRGHRKLKKRHHVDFGGRLGWEIDIWRSEAQEIKSEQDIGEIIFRGNNFFLFSFRLIEALRIFFEIFWENFWTNYHVQLPYIDTFDTYMVIGAWNTKPCTSCSNFISWPSDLQISISHPNLPPKSTWCLFFSFRCPLG